MQNYYSILGISNTADQECIKNSYRSLVRIYHSDLQKNEHRVWADEKLKNINIAYEILSDCHKRKSYDDNFYQFFKSKETNRHKNSEKKYKDNGYKKSKSNIKINIIFNKYIFYFLVGIIFFNGIFGDGDNSDAASKSPDGYVCRLATVGLGAAYNNKRTWDMTAKSYVREAKARGLSCGIIDN